MPKKKKASKKKASAKRKNSKRDDTTKMVKELKAAKKKSKITFEDPGQRPRCMRLRKGVLGVDTTYQRDYNISHVLEKARTFNYFACGALLVMRRPDGSYFIVDGQQRWRAAMIRDDIKTLDCLVIEASGKIADEAQAFLEASKVWTLSAYHKHRALYAFGDPAAVLMEEAANASGYKIVPMSRKTNHTVGCVSTMRTYATCLPDVFVELFELCAAIYDGKPIDKVILRGLGWGERHFRKQRGGSDSFLDPKVKRALITLGSGRLKAKIVLMAEAFGQSGVRGGSGGMTPTNGIIAALNKQKGFGIELF